jgi:hypothetical protein
MTYKIRAVIEVLAKPEKAAVLMLKEIAKLVDKREKIRVLEEKHAKPENIGGDFFTAFVELELEVDDFSNLVGFIIDFGPVSIEIIEPEDLVEIDVGDMEAVLNDLIGKIQDYDKKLKLVTAEYLKFRKKATQGKQDSSKH